MLAMFLPYLLLLRSADIMYGYKDALHEQQWHSSDQQLQTISSLVYLHLSASCPAGQTSTLSIISTILAISNLLNLIENDDPQCFVRPCCSLCGAASRFGGSQLSC